MSGLKCRRCGGVRFERAGEFTVRTVGAPRDTAKTGQVFRCLQCQGIEGKMLKQPQPKQQRA